MSMLKIERKPVSSLLPDPANERKHGEKNLTAIKGSLKKFGQVEPLILNKRTGLLIGGHGRLEAMKAIGMSEADVVEVDLDNTQAAALRIALNRTAEIAEWDAGVLGDTLKGLMEDDFDLSQIGFDADDLESILPKVEPEFLADEDEIPEKVETICKPGDLWKLGNHRLLCGDSTDVLQVERLMGGEKADMVFTDPPYNFETEGGGILGASQKMKDIKKLRIDKFDPQSLDKGTADTHVYFCNRLLIPAYIDLAKSWEVSWDLAVNHKVFSPANWGGHLQTDLEYIMVLGKQSPNKGLEPHFYSKLFSGKKTQDDFMSAGWGKPVALCEKFIRLYSKTLVYEPFLGSGSTLIACEKTGRRCFGMEIDPHYCDVIINRWQNFTGKKAELIPHE